jgi:hypothetical protein
MANAMDCYVIRIYRRFAGRKGEFDEAAGVVETVGQDSEEQRFTSYSELVALLRKEGPGQPVGADAESVEERASRWAPNIRSNSSR